MSDPRCFPCATVPSCGKGHDNAGEPLSESGSYTISNHIFDHDRAYLELLSKLRNRDALKLVLRDAGYEEDEILDAILIYLGLTPGLLA